MLQRPTAAVPVTTVRPRVGGAGRSLGYADRSTPMPPRPRAWVVWLVAVGVIGTVVAAGVLPSFNRSRCGDDYNLVKCRSNLHQIAMACSMYAATTGGGRFPDSAGTILAETDLTSQVFNCPSTADDRAPGPTAQRLRQQINASLPPGAGGCCSYVYVGAGLTSGSPSPAATVVAYEPATHHGGAGGHVAYANAAVRWHPAAKLNQIIAAVRAGRNPPP